MKRFALILPFVAGLGLSVAASVYAQTQAYIPSSGDGSVARITTDDEAVTAVTFGDAPYGAAVAPRGDWLVVTRPDADSVTIVATDDFSDAGAQLDRAVGDDPRGVAIESQGDYAYVANYGDDTVSEIRIDTAAVTDTIAVGDGPWGVAAIYDEAEATNKIYVANNLGDSISVITDSEVETITDVGSGPVGLALSPDGAYLYAALADDDAVAVIQTSDNTLIRTISAGDAPWGAAVGSDGRYVYVSNSLDDTVTVIDADTHTVHGTYAVGDQPMGVACPKNGDFAYVINQLDNSISKIDMVDQSVAMVADGQISDAYGMGTFIGGTPPDAPSDLSAVENSYDKIDLSWTDNSGDESGFRIERRQDTEEPYTRIATVDADATTYTDIGLVDNTTYHYRVQAFNEAADSDYAVSAEATTAEGSFSWCFIGTLMH